MSEIYARLSESVERLFDVAYVGWCSLMFYGQRLVSGEYDEVYLLLAIIVAVIRCLKEYYAFRSARIQSKDAD